MKIKISEESCIACGACQAICDEVFEVDDVSKIKVNPIPNDLQDKVLEAIESCPTYAIFEEKEE